MKTTRPFVRRFVHLGLACSLMGITAAAMHAESFSVHVPFPFTAAGKMLPAGNYRVEPVATGLLVIHGDAATDTVAFAASPVGYAGTTHPGLSFASNPEIAVLSGIRMNSGMTFSVMSAKRLAAATAVPAKGTVALSHP